MARELKHENPMVGSASETTKANPPRGPRADPGQGKRSPGKPSDHRSHSTGWFRTRVRTPALGHRSRDQYQA